MALALVGVGAHVIGGFFPHTVTEDGQGLGRSYALASNFFDLWWFLPPLVAVLLAVVAGVRIARGPSHRFEAGILLGLGGALLVLATRWVLLAWLEILGPHVGPHAGGFARVGGALLVLVAGLLALTPETDGRRPLAMPRVAIVVGAVILFVGHLVPVVVRYGKASPLIDLGAATRDAFIVRGEVASFAEIVAVVTLAVLVLALPGRPPLSAERSWP